MNNNNDKPSIAQRAHSIINERSEEKERQYGPIGQGFERAALIASGMSGKEWNAHDMFVAMLALKFSRQSYNFREDNMMDAMAYMQGWQNYIDQTEATGFKQFDESQVKSADEDPEQLQLPFELASDYDLGEFSISKPKGVTAKPISPLSKSLEAFDEKPQIDLKPRFSRYT